MSCKNSSFHLFFDIFTVPKQISFIFSKKTTIQTKIQLDLPRKWISFRIHLENICHYETCTMFLMWGVGKQHFHQPRLQHINIDLGCYSATHVLGSLNMVDYWQQKIPWCILIYKPCLSIHQIISWLKMCVFKWIATYTLMLALLMPTDAQVSNTRISDTSMSNSGSDASISNEQHVWC